ncbi:PREDICTED: uncharacterized protein LOC108560693 [Nicrophorus vespilloides]|uniref:Uncharacterized protein LOC108560693 n=1 Tax=Nicrophorus vespilloides TaxID=110193 RepID=A0ABM1MGZ1_NICVS|nr:PREDICTED: uncharacterized protein LOC108560693 [Nicrophorus vespilloides]
MKKVAKNSVLMERLHKGFVLTCLGITIYGMTEMGMRWYRYFTVLRPQIKEKERLDKLQLLAEGSSDVLIDTAANLKM